MADSAVTPSSDSVELIPDDSPPSPVTDDGIELSEASPAPAGLAESPPPPDESSPPPPSPPPPSASPPPPKANSPPPTATPASPSPPPPPSGSGAAPKASPQSPPPPANSSPPSTPSKSPPPPDSSLESPASKSPAPSGSPSSESNTSSPPVGSSPPPPSSASPNSTFSPPPPVSLTPPQTSLSNSSTVNTTANVTQSTPAHAPSQNNTSNTTDTDSSTTVKTVGGVIGGVFIIALIAALFIVRRRRTKRADAYYYGKRPPMGASVAPDPFYGAQPPNPAKGNGYGAQMGQPYHGGGPESGIISSPRSFFSYDEVMEITNGFARQNIIGEGGFGCVFKGCLPDGKMVAVKQLKAGSGQGEREFRAEVEIISRVHHRHLVSLVGYCIAENQRLLIYEFVPNKTLEHHLFGKGLPVLDWSKRVKIALGAAKGLAYLHEDCHPKIIHRDIKSANILLDEFFEAQVADFGLAKLTNDAHTHVSTRVVGTFGYMAPEYANSGKLTDRSDVFSFGVVLLELVTGRKPVDQTQPLGDESLVEWARPLLISALETGDFSELVDPRLENHYVESELFRMIEAAAACVRHSAPKRPRMAKVMRALENDGEMSDLTNGVKFGQSTVYDSGQYNQDIMNFRRMALGDEESSEFDTYSGEYKSKNLSQTANSSGFPSDESETQAMNAHNSEQNFSSAQSNYNGHRF